MATDDGQSHVAKWIKKRPRERARGRKAGHVNEPQPELGPKSR